VQFIFAADVQAELSTVTVRRLLDDDGDGLPDPERINQLCTHASGHVVARIKGYKFQVPDAAHAPPEWKRLAIRWVIAQLAVEYPTFFRNDGAKLIEIVESEILAARAAEVEDNTVATASEPQEVWGPWGGPGFPWGPF